LVIYIHTNPQKHGFMDDFRTWKWSSFGALCSDRETRLERTSVIDWFGGHQSFEELHQQAFNPAEIAALVGDDEDW